LQRDQLCNVAEPPALTIIVATLATNFATWAINLATLATHVATWAINLATLATPHNVGEAPADHHCNIGDQPCNVDYIDYLSLGRKCVDLCEQLNYHHNPKYCC
jgi:hypothetical protein